MTSLIITKYAATTLESCAVGLVFSKDLQTCDWPRQAVQLAKSGHGFLNKFAFYILNFNAKR
jgi:hypothetical protein